MNKRVMVIATHPDDELLGCGGTLAKHVEEGDYVRVVIVCEGMTLRYDDACFSMDQCRINAATKLGIQESICLYFEDQKLDTYPILEIVRALEKEVESFQPNIIYCQNGGDINNDHKIVYNAAQVAFRPLHNSIEEVYSFYTPSSTEWQGSIDFKPDMWVDISDYLDKKIEAFQCYESEVKPFPHPRSIENLRYMAFFFGAQANMEAAECFHTVRRYLR